jgi:pyridoxal 5'-phosphate synthase pdxS subunit
MIRTKGEAGTGDVVEAVKHQRTVMADIRRAAAMSDEELYAFAKDLSAPYHLLKETARLKRLPVVSYVLFQMSRRKWLMTDSPLVVLLPPLMLLWWCSSDVMVSLSDLVSVSLVYYNYPRRMLMVVLSGDPAKRARAIVQAVTHYNNPAVLAEISTDLGDAMVGIST